MNTREYIKSLFKDYEETGSLRDFMEELQSNMDARIANLVRKGIPEEEAFNKASAELGDVSTLADELSLIKRREVFEELYMDMRKYLNTKRVAAYVIFGVVFIFGIITALVSLYSFRWPLHTGMPDKGWIFLRENLTVLIAAFSPFALASVIGFTFLGLTQETKTHFPLGKKRAIWYTVAAGLIVFGIFAMLLSFFSTNFTESTFQAMISIATLIPFVLPGGGMLCFLILTEKNRLKPWAISLHENAIKEEMAIWNDPATAASP